MIGSICIDSCQLFKLNVIILGERVFNCHGYRYCTHKLEVRTIVSTEALAVVVSAEAIVLVVLVSWRKGL